MKRHLMILSLYDAIHHLKSQYDFDLILLKDLIELVAFSQIDSVRANGAESIFSDVPAYVSPYDLIRDDLRAQFGNGVPKERLRRLNDAVLEIWQELPPEDLYWRLVDDLLDPTFKIRWQQTDLILEIA